MNQRQVFYAIYKKHNIHYWIKGVFSLLLVSMLLGCFAKKQAQENAVLQQNTMERDLSWVSLSKITANSADLQSVPLILEVSLGYGTESLAASEEIRAKTIEIKDLIRSYFSQKSVKDIKPQWQDRYKLEIRDSINTKILKKSKISDIRFDTLEVLQ